MSKDCPRCGTIIDKESRRCDCGYDFDKGVVGHTHFQQALPKGLRTSLIGISILLVAIAGLFALSDNNPTHVAIALLWVGIMWMLYGIVVTKHYWAYIAIVGLTLPIGLALLNFKQEVRLYCLQE